MVVQQFIRLDCLGTPQNRKYLANIQQILASLECHLQLRRSS